MSKAQRLRRRKPTPAGYIDQHANLNITVDRYNTDGLPGGYTFGIPWGHKGLGAEVVGAVRFQDSKRDKPTGTTEAALLMALKHRLNAIYQLNRNPRAHKALEHVDAAICLLRAPMEIPHDQ